VGVAGMTKERAGVGLGGDASVFALAAVTFGVTGEQRGSASLADAQMSPRMPMRTTATSLAVAGSAAPVHALEDTPTASRGDRRMATLRGTCVEVTGSAVPGSLLSP
jgi:hypothetical protein